MMSRIRRPIAKSVWLLAVAAWTLCGAVLPASGLERQAVLGMFDEITATTNSGLETWVNDGKESYVTVGDPVVMHFRSDRDAYLTVVYLDADGTATVIYPSADPEAAHIRADQGLRFPSSGGAFELSAQPPLGYETIFALSTPEPMTLERLGLSARDSANGVELERVGDLVQRLKSIASELGEGVAAARFDHRVRARGTTQYTTRGIVEHFTVRTRSIRRPKLDLDIKFQFGSATLTPEAAHDLDAVARALLDPRLINSNFTFAGHTDDVGDSTYNKDLSMERAKIALGYIVENHGVDPTRLVAQGMGESEPVVPNANESGRALNRRVVLMLVP